MPRHHLNLVFLALAACQTSPVAVPPAANTALAPPALVGPVKSAVIVERQGSVPQVTVSVPSQWQHQVIPGEDTIIHVISGNQGRMQFEYWGLNTNLSCHLPSCGLRHMVVGGRIAQLNFASDGMSWKAFIAVEPGDAPGMRGLRISAQCSTPAACQEALAVLGTLRTS